MWRLNRPGPENMATIFKLLEIFDRKLAIVFKKQREQATESSCLRLYWFPGCENSPQTKLWYALGQDCPSSSLPYDRTLLDLCLKCCESTTSSSRNHLPSAKEKEQWKNSQKKNKLFNLQIAFFFFLSLDPSYFRSF